FREGRSGIVLEHVAGGYAFRASRREAQACSRLFERPVERGLSQAAPETLAVAAHPRPVSPPGLARPPRRPPATPPARLAGRGPGATGAVRYRTPELFERVFALESLSALPRLDDLGDDAGAIRERLEQVAAQRA